MLTLAALAAPAGHWAAFESEWRDVLDAHGVQEFHATDCEGRHRAFRGWASERVESLQRALIGVIVSNEHGTLLFSSTLVLPGYEAVRDRLRPLLRIPSGLHVSGGWDDAYFYLFQQLLQMCLDDELLAELAPDVDMHFVLDQHEFAARAIALAVALHKFREGGHRIRDVSYRSRKDKIVLQAADLVAYEFYRSESASARGGSNSRWQYDLLQARLRKAVFMDSGYLTAVVADMEARAAARKSGAS